MTPATRWRSGLMLFAGLTLFYAGFHQTRDWNSASRLLLTYALVQHGSPEITPFVAHGGALVRNPLTWDLSSPDRRRYFCDKAPGQSVAGAAAFFVLRTAGAATNHPTLQESPLDAAKFSRWPTDRWVTWLTSGWAAAGSAVLAMLLVLRWGGSAWAGVGTGLALGLATPMVPYATLFYGHVLAGFFLLLSVYFCTLAGAAQRGRASFAGLAGLAAGCAVAVEYTCAVFVLAAALVGVVYGLVTRRGAQEALAFAVGGACIAGLLGWYHVVVTGDAFSTPYRYEVQKEFAAVHGQSGGIPKFAPNADAARELLVGPRRGLLWFAPVAFAALFGLTIVYRKSPYLAGVTTLTVVLLVFAISGFPNWDGGLAVGPRFLVPLLPLSLAASGAWLAAPCGPMGLALRGLWIVAAGWGAALNIGMTVAGARMPADTSVADYLRDALPSAERSPTVIDTVLNAVGGGPFPVEWTVAGWCVAAALLAAALLAFARRVYIKS